jgi:hypothetical protein
MERYDFDVVRGDDAAPFSVSWADSEATPIDVASARMDLRDSTSGPELVRFNESDGLDVVGNEITVNGLRAALTEDLPEWCVYDLEATAVGGQVKTLIGGKVHVVRDVTHD